VGLRFLILGAGSFAEDVADVASEVEAASVTGFVDTRLPAGATEELAGLPVYSLAGAKALISSHRLICAIGDSTRAPIIETARQAGFRFANIVHPTASISRSVELGEGVFISRRVSIAAATRIGDHTIVNRGALIGHHTQVGAFCTIGPGANIAARVRVGDGAYLGMGAVILDKRSVGNGSTIGAGAVVTRDIADGVIALGVPARERGAPG